MTTFRDLPHALLDKIFQALPDVCAAHPQTLLNLACVDKWFAAQLNQPSADVLWDAAWSNAKLKRPAAAAEEQKADTALSFKPRDLLRLAGFNGCMLCGAKAIRKVYWEFSIRCCKDCLLEHSLAEKHIKQKYALEPSSFQHLPHRQVQLYHAGSFTIRTYWKAHLLPVLQQQHGVQSFEEYTQRQDHERQIKEAKESDDRQLKEAKRADRCEQIQAWCN